MSYRFARCQVHPAFDVEGWFLEVQGDDPQLIVALHKSIAAKYHSMLGQDSHGCGNDATRLAATWLQSLEAELQEGSVLVNPAGGFVAKRDLIVLDEVTRHELVWAGATYRRDHHHLPLATTATLLSLQQQRAGFRPREIHHVSGGKTGCAEIRSG